MKKAFLPLLAAGTLALALLGLTIRVALLGLRYLLGKRQVEAEWRTRAIHPLDGFGATSKLEILPLIDFRASSPTLKSEAGVSYLVRTDHLTLLFDLGLNGEGLHPSPLLENMVALKVRQEEIEAIFISHLHGDHVGGRAFAQHQTFSLSGKQTDLSGISAYVPVPMRHPTAQCVHVQESLVMAPGIASTGPIGEQHFFMGRLIEQGLVVNVARKGLVVISGCGHEGVAKLLARVEEMCKEPIYGIVGGFHLPVTGWRIPRKGLSLRRFLPWWDRPSRRYLAKTLAEFQDRRPKLVALSPHDSCDWSIEAFRQVFRAAYRDLQVGENIVVGGRR